MPWHHLGEEYFWNENNEEALKYYRKAARLEPDEFDYSFRIATILYNQKDKLLAIRELNYFLDKEPSPQISFFFSLYSKSID